MNSLGMPSATALYARPAGAAQTLRVVLVAPNRVPGWVNTLHELAAECAWVDLTLLTSTELQCPKVEGVPILVRAAVGLEGMLLGCDRLLERVAPSSGTVPGGIGPQDLESITETVNALKPDLVIVVGANGGSHALATAARFGCWNLDAELLDQRHAGIGLLSPMVRGDSTTCMGITLAQEGGTAFELADSTGQTRAGSFLRQREAAFRKLPGLLLRALHRLAGGDLAIAPHTAAVLRLHPQPDSGRMLGVRALALLAKAAVRRLMGRRRDGSTGWTLVLRLAGTPLDPEDPVIGSHALLRPATGWWADPFMLNADGRKLIFVEEMDDPKRNNANIACVELAEGGARRLGLALDEPGHLSYPQVFPWQGDWYMTVESSYDSRVSLYRATRFPLEWARIKDLISGRVCVDPTLHFQDGHWYLFTNVSQNGTSTSDELFLFVADKLDGEYLPHPASPLVCDVRRARMAGKLFWHHGRLIRPAQDCGPCYGSAVVFNEVMELGPSVYRERPLSKLAPHFTRRVAGCHTYNADGQIEVLDVFGRPPSGTAYLSVSDASLPPRATAQQPQVMAQPAPLSSADAHGHLPTAPPAYGCKQGAVQGPPA